MKLMNITHVNTQFGFELVTYFACAIFRFCPMRRPTTTLQGLVVKWLTLRSFVFTSLPRYLTSLITGCHHSSRNAEKCTAPSTVECHQKVGTRTYISLLNKYVLQKFFLSNYFIIMKKTKFCIT